MYSENQQSRVASSGRHDWFNIRLSYLNSLLEKSRRYTSMARADRENIELNIRANNFSKRYVFKDSVLSSMRNIQSNITEQIHELIQSLWNLHATAYQVLFFRIDIEQMWTLLDSKSNE